MRTFTTHKEFGDKGYLLLLVCCVLFLPVDVRATPAKQAKVASVSAGD
jgi:hypothetical protein